MPHSSPFSKPGAAESAPPPSVDAPCPAVADVIVPRHLNRSFTYIIPPPLHGRLKVGSRVVVPFGNSTLQGVVVALSAKQAGGTRTSGRGKFALRPITALLDDSSESELAADLLELARLVSERYLAPWGQALRLILPPSLPARKTTRRTKARIPAPKDGISPIVPADAGSLAALPAVPSAWDERLKTALDDTGFASFLLHAPTAHRTAFLMRTAEAALARHRTVLIVAPEIARADALASLARTRWGEQVQELHSGLSPADRVEAWTRIRSGQARVVIGTRSAVFAPLDSLGVLCVEDEDDPNLKEETEPRYHAREVARIRAGQQKAVLLLGSAHPSLESLHDRSFDGTFLLADGNGTGTTAPPPVELVDLRRTPWGTLLSEPMVAGIRHALERRAGVILFLNRKGFASLLLCRDCGAAPTCGRCSVSLTFYKRAGHLVCHYCGASGPIPETCPSCLAARLDPVGFGTERIEVELRRLFADARICRLDRELARTPAKAQAMRERAAAGEWDILIGTQMLFQCPALPPAGFVGIPHADAGLHRPDFRAGERTYHALLDAVALARPGEDSRIVLQTYLPTHHAIAAAVARNPTMFFETELAFRQTLSYPPFTNLISLRVSGRDQPAVKEASQRWAKVLRAPRARKQSSEDIVIWGPIPASVEKLRGRHRWQLLVKSADGEAARQLVGRSLEMLEEKGTPRGLKFEVDVDPLEMG